MVSLWLTTVSQAILCECANCQWQCGPIEDLCLWNVNCACVMSFTAVANVMRPVCMGWLLWQADSYVCLWAPEVHRRRWVGTGGHRDAGSAMSGELAREEWDGVGGGWIMHEREVELVAVVHPESQSLPRLNPPSQINVDLCPRLGWCKFKLSYSSCSGPTFAETLMRLQKCTLCWDFQQQNSPTGCSGSHARGATLPWVDSNVFKTTFWTYLEISWVGINFLACYTAPALSFITLPTSLLTTHYINVTFN